MWIQDIQASFHSNNFASLADARSVLHQLALILSRQCESHQSTRERSFSAYYVSLLKAISCLLSKVRVIAETESNLSSMLQGVLGWRLTALMWFKQVMFGASVQAHTDYSLVKSTLLIAKQSFCVLLAAFQNYRTLELRHLWLADKSGPWAVSPIPSRMLKVTLAVWSKLCHHNQRDLPTLNHCKRWSKRQAGGVLPASQARTK